VFLAAIITNLDLPSGTPVVDQCGTCTRCLDLCPTNALREPYVLDATRCLSYLTIERRGPVPDEHRDAIRQQVFGCDICQDVCPWNRRAMVSTDQAWQARSGLAYPRLLDLCRWTDDEWRARLKDSALERAGLTRLRRSLAFAAAHVPQPAGREALEMLAGHPSGNRPEVQEAIAWARQRIDC
jgi:epoxyqueuosine reductase